MTSRIAYFINQYPKVSHSFIRREILALERQGIDVLRIALRGWDAEIVDPDDRAELEQTRYILQRGPLPIIVSMLKFAFCSPARFLSALGLAVTMSASSDRGLSYHLGYLGEACRMLPWLTAAQIKHIHAHFGTNSAEVVMLAHVLGGPAYSFTAHGSETVDNAQLMGLGEKIRRAAFVVTVCSYGRSQLFRWVENEHWAKIHVVHCGLESSFHNIPCVPLSDAPRLVCVGRLCNQKGQLLLVQAAKRLMDRGLSFEIVLAGDGEMRPDIEALIEKLGLRSHIRITGWISGDQVREAILAARALVLPSFSEGLPVVLMEAMALRRPVLTTYVGGIPELVKPGENGWLVPAGSIDDLTMALESLLLTPIAELKALGDAGYAKVMERHSIDNEVKKLIALFGRGDQPTTPAI
jgi:colanic acid/amylovoran biosynthesis glycosyltransferase